MSTEYKFIKESIYFMSSFKISVPARRKPAMFQRKPVLVESNPASVVEASTQKRKLVCVYIVWCVLWLVMVYFLLDWLLCPSGLSSVSSVNSTRKIDLYELFEALVSLLLSKCVDLWSKLLIMGSKLIESVFLRLIRLLEETKSLSVLGFLLSCIILSLCTLLVFLFKILGVSGRAARSGAYFLGKLIYNVIYYLCAFLYWLCHPWEGWDLRLEGLTKVLNVFLETGKYVLEKLFGGAGLPDYKSAWPKIETGQSGLNL